MSATTQAAPRRRLRRLPAGIVLGRRDPGLGRGLRLVRARRAADAGTCRPDADGIVALTGGADRIETALRLLTEGARELLLVSGVARGAELSEFAHRAGLSTGPLAPLVTLGRSATSTVGNATETADWARAHDMRSLIVVTSGYHMARALTEIGRALPDVRLYPVPVLSPAIRRPADVATLRLLAAEYTKFLAADLGLTHLGANPVRDGA